VILGRVPPPIPWKAWYAAEAASEQGRAAVLDALRTARDPGATAPLRAALERGGIVSFPHTTLRGSATPLARTASAILDGGFARVVALGVLHGSSLPEPERTLARAAASGDREALARVGGAFVDEGPATTPFGVVATGPVPAPAPGVRAGGPLLSSEFSLDLFLAVLAAAAAERGRAPPAVSRVFVGPTSAGDGDPALAADVVQALAPLLGRSVALVATGDLVHAGHGYSTPEEIATLPRERDALRAHFEPRVRGMLLDAFAGGDAARRADRESVALRNDQRHLLPVLARLTGPGARPGLESFELTDYGSILHEPSPCVVASALVSVTPAA